MKTVLIALIACWAGACVPPPSVSLRVRARVQRTQARSAQTLEARVDCGWTLERRALAPTSHADAVEHPRARVPAAGSEPLPCAQPSACDWEAEQRELALAAFMSPASLGSGGAP